MMSDFTSASTEYEFVFKAVLHVLVYAYMELAAIVIESPGTVPACKNGQTGSASRGPPCL